MKISIIVLSALACLSPLNATIIGYGGALLGANEVPPVTSNGSGQARVFIDDVLNTIRIFETFSGLTSGTTASHIHCCATPTAGVATTTPTFAGFPLGVTSGTYDATFDLSAASTYNPAFVTAQGSVAAARAALLAGLSSGVAYLNVHTSNNPGGELRANLVPLPEPGSWALMGAALIGIGALRRART